MINFKITLLVFFVLIMGVVLKPNLALASVFGITPTTIELNLKPGEYQTRFVTVRNLSSDILSLNLALDSFSLDEETDTDLVFGSDRNSLFDLSPYLKLNRSEIDLLPQTETQIQINVSVPDDLNPGSRQAVLFISTKNKNQISTGANISSRLGVLIFAKIEGDFVEEGYLDQVKFLNGPFFINRVPRAILLSYINQGNTYLNPYGYFEIKNLFTRQTKVYPINPWFVLPDASRIREISLNQNLNFGLYKLTIWQNRGYDNVIDTKSAWAMVITTSQIVIGFLGSLIILGLVFYLFKLKRK